MPKVEPNILDDILDRLHRIELAVVRVERKVVNEMAISQAESEAFARLSTDIDEKFAAVTGALTAAVDDLTQQRDALKAQNALDATQEAAMQATIDALQAAATSADADVGAAIDALDAHVASLGQAAAPATPADAGTPPTA